MADVYVIIATNSSFYVGKRDSVSQLQKYSSTTRSLQMTYEGHTDTVFTVILWNGMLFSGSGDRRIICWNDESGQVIRTYHGHINEVRAIAIIDGYLYSIGDENFMIKWIIDTAAIEIQVVAEHRNSLLCLAFDKRNIFSGSIDATVIKRDLNTLSRSFIYISRFSKLWSIVLWKNFVVTGGETPKIVIQDRYQNHILPVEIPSAHSDQNSCMVVLNDTLFSGGADSVIRRRSLIDYTELKVYYGAL